MDVEKIEIDPTNKLKATIGLLAALLVGVSGYAFNNYTESTKLILSLKSQLNSTKSSAITSAKADLDASKTNQDLTDSNKQINELQQKINDQDEKLKAFAKQAEICDAIKKHFKIND